MHWKVRFSFPINQLNNLNQISAYCMYFHQFHPHSHPWNRTRLRREHRSGLCTGTRMGWLIPPCTRSMRYRLLQPRHCQTSPGPQMWAVQKDRGRYSQKVTNLETANFSHPFYGTPCVNTFITFQWFQIWNKVMKIKSNLFWNKKTNPFHG